MKRNKPKVSSKWLIPVLLIIVGSSSILLVNAFLRHPYGTDKLSNAANGSTQAIGSTNTTTSTNGFAFPIQAHQVLPTVGRTSSPSVTPIIHATPTPSTPGGAQIQGEMEIQTQV